MPRGKRSPTLGLQAQEALKAQAEAIAMPKRTARKQALLDAETKEVFRSKRGKRLVSDIQRVFDAEAAIPKPTRIRPSLATEKELRSRISVANEMIRSLTNQLDDRRSLIASQTDELNKLRRLCGDQARLLDVREEQIRDLQQALKEALVDKINAENRPWLARIFGGIRPV